MKRDARGPIALIITALVWGFAFSAQSNAMNHVGPYTFVFLRSLITCAVLFAALPFLRKITKHNTENSVSARQYIRVGFICGTILALATVLQQIGLVTTIPAKSGFITALYIIFVPILGLLFRQRPTFTIWIGALLSLCGLYFLCMKTGLALEPGDLITLSCALGFAVHIIVVDRLGGSLDSVILSAVQFAAAALWTGILAFTLETPNWSGISACWIEILYAAVFSGAIGYTLQIVGQKYTEPTLAALLMCLESVFSAIGGWLLLGNALSGRELLGCALMLSASMVAQIPVGSRQRTNASSL
ncbi:MAG: DMT family transporter [Clostridia bacterium]|nr:DMT family transporter [Clostridia bacterium]